MVWDSAKRAYLDFNDAQLTSLPPLPPARDHWTTPPTGFFKVNVDGATEAGGGNSCIGVVIRDFVGFPIGALSLVLPSCFPVETTEAYALLHGVLFASEMQIDQVFFESNALSIILGLTSGVAGNDFGHILEDIG
nr:putative ribonuclease h protein [Quercus suber]